MSRSPAADRSSRRPRLRPTVLALESRALLTTAGALDTTFGGSGTGYYLGTTGLFPNLVQVESDGSVVAATAGNSATGAPMLGFLKLTANGTPDTSFGANGEVEVGLSADVASLTFSGAASMAIESNGKILVVANLYGAGNTVEDTAVAQFDANGQPDTTFGTNGVEVLNLDSQFGLDRAFIQYAAVQANGEIVLTGSSGASSYEINTFEIQANGAIDTSFGTNGVVTASQIPSLPYGLAIQPDGQILILDSNGLIRLNPNGSVDTTLSQAGFIASGITLVDNGLIVQPNGQILLLGTTETSQIDEVVVRLNADGSLDTMKSLNGTLSGSEPISFALQPNGDVAVAGTTFVSINGTYTRENAVYRLTSNLTTDNSFGTDGLSEFVIPGDDVAAIGPLEVAVSPNNQILVLGDNTHSVVSGPLAPPTVYAIARLTAPATAVPGDFTGDGISDLAVYLPASGSFAIRPSQGGADEIIPFGIAGAGQTIPAPGDYTGSGVTEIAAYLPSQGIYAYRPANGGPDVLQSFGIAGPGQSIPVPGDYFGTGQDDIAVYMPSIGSFGIRNPDGGPDQIIAFGTAGAGQSIPAPGDYFGTGQTDLAVYLTSIGAFAIRNPAGGADEIIPFGIPGAGNSIPIPGDYDGSGKTELAVYFPKLGEFAYRPANGGPDVIEAFGAANDGSLPMPGDYDGSGKTEIAVYDPNYASFAYRPADGAADVIFDFGTPGPGASIPTATPPGALPPFNGVVSATSVSSNPVVSTLSLAVPSGPSSALKRVGRLVVNQAKLDPADRLF